MKHTPLKPSGKPWKVKPGAKRLKSRRRAIAGATKAQQAYQDRARALGCVICRFRHALGLQANVNAGPVRIHHRNQDDKHGQPQLGQDEVCALCDWHHDGWQLEGETVDTMTAKYGPSFKYGRTFRDWTAEVLPNYTGRGTEAWQQYQDYLLGMGPPP